jgi:hypothetical protein
MSHTEKWHEYNKFREYIREQQQKLIDENKDEWGANYYKYLSSEEWQKKIIENVKSLLNENGKAYFTVRRDLKRGLTCVGNYSQRYVELDFKSIKKTKCFEIYEMEGK